jgi:hypothetical protein
VRVHLAVAVGAEIDRDDAHLASGCPIRLALRPGGPDILGRRTAAEPAVAARLHAHRVQGAADSLLVDGRVARGCEHVIEHHLAEGAPAFGNEGTRPAKGVRFVVTVESIVRGQQVVGGGGIGLIPVTVDGAHHRCEPNGVDHPVRVIGGGVAGTFGPHGLTGGSTTLGLLLGPWNRRGRDGSARGRDKEVQKRAARRKRRIARVRRRTRARVGVITRKLGVHEHVRRIVRAGRRARSRDDASLIAATVDRIRAARGPIVVGPWIEEVGFEILYWVPFLRWLALHHDLDTSQWIVASRGGTRCWYGELAAGGYADALSVLSPQEFRAANEERWREVGSQKQRYESDVEERLLDRLQSSGAIPADYELLGPSSMYRPFWRSWTEAAPGNLVERSTLYTALPPPPLPEGLELPDEFIVVKWYFRPSLPNTPQNRVRIREITQELAERTPVVLLHENPRLDDHEEVDLSPVPGLRAALRGVPPERNLEVQSAIIARAKGYVGTYGGLGYVPMVYGVPSRLYASDTDQLSASHVRTGIEVAARLRVAHSLEDLLA